jgi:hypothetical protein
MCDRSTAAKRSHFRGFVFYPYVSQAFDFSQSRVTSNICFTDLNLTDQRMRGRKREGGPR